MLTMSCQQLLSTWKARPCISCPWSDSASWQAESLFHSPQEHEAPLCALKATAALLYCLTISALAKKQVISRRNFLVPEVSVMFQQ